MIMRYKIVESQTSKRYEISCPMILSRVLCPIDFSQFSDRAISLVRTTKGIGEVILLNVVSQGETEAEIEAALEDAKRRIEGIRRDLSFQGIQVRAVVKTGNPGTEITRVAEDEDVSAIWISSHGKGWFRDFLLGSTAYTVAMNAKKPVIIIRHPHQEEKQNVSVWTSS